MPGSSNNGKLYTALMISKLHELLNLSKILDVGVGSGTYSDLLRPYLHGTEWIGMEVWEPYLKEYELVNKYDEVLLEDARYFDYSTLENVDLSIAGDMAEHMEKSEAQSLVSSLIENSRLVLLAIPIVPSPQGEVHGNPFERHVKEDWSNNEVRESFSGIATAYIHNHKGVYFLTKDEELEATIKNVHRVVAHLTFKKLEGERVIFSTR